LGFLIVTCFYRLLQVVTLGLLKSSTIYDAREAKSGVTVALEEKAKIPWSLHVGSLYVAVFMGTILASAAFDFLVMLRMGRPVVEFMEPILMWLNVAIGKHLPAVIPALLLRRYSWSWVLYPAIAILTARDTIMVQGALEMLKNHPEPTSALLIMGRAHVWGVSQQLIKEHQFKEIP
jgi:hypothetical protein